MKLAALENGIWHASFRDPIGNQRIVSLRTADRSIAEAVAAALVELAAPVTGSTAPTVRRLFRDWLREKECEVSAVTLDFYRQTSNGFLRFLGDRSEADINTVERADIINYRTILSRRLCAKTVNHRVKTLRSIFEFAVRQRHIWENPAAFVKAVRNDEPRVRRPFTLEEVRQLLEIADPEWQTLIKLGLYTGQRIGDLVRLTWGNVDFDRQLIVITTRKTKKHLIIPMAPPLKEHLSRFKKPGAIAEMPILPKAFRTLQKAHGRVTTLSNRFGELLAECGFRTNKPHHIIVGNGRDGRRERNALSFHCLRHTAVTLLKEAGIPQAVVLELIGHDSPEVSALYTHVGEEALNKACAAMPVI